MMRKFSCLLLALFIIPVFSLGIAKQAYAQEDNLEYKVKTAFLLNFGKFISWQDQSAFDQNKSFKLGVIGKNPFGSYLLTLEKKKIGGRKIQVVQFADIESAKQCQMIFISRSERENVGKIIASLAGYAVVTVSDIENFARQGGMIEFIQVDGRLSFIVNLQQVHNQGIKIEASLLNLAKTVL